LFFAASIRLRFGERKKKIPLFLKLEDDGGNRSFRPFCDSEYPSVLSYAANILKTRTKLLTVTVDLLHSTNLPNCIRYPANTATRTQFGPIQQNLPSNHSAAGRCAAGVSLR
jgi:hypothetical protein